MICAASSILDVRACKLFLPPRPSLHHEGTMSTSGSRGLQKLCQGKIYAFSDIIIKRPSLCQHSQNLFNIKTEPYISFYHPSICRSRKNRHHLQHSFLLHFSIKFIIKVSQFFHREMYIITCFYLPLLSTSVVTTYPLPLLSPRWSAALSAEYSLLIHSALSAVIFFFTIDMGICQP